MDVNALFEKYSIEEIRDVEKKTRHDIEKKKEDLRQMVGERYRELIEAADTIGEMKRSSESVILSIEKIQDLCQNLKCSLSLGRPLPDRSATKDSNRPLEFAKLYGTSVSLKMLMDIPEKIWSALEAGEYLTATRLYLLSRYIYTVLQIDGQGAQIMTHFPILARQWATICHFKTTILQSCWSFLRDVCLSDEAVSECLVSILLLEDFTTEKAFEQFIAARLECVQQLFQQDQADSVIRSQISSVIMMISSTIHQIYTIFHHEVIHSKDGPQIKCNRLVLLLERVTCRSSAGAILSNDDLSQPSMKYLAKAILDFRPSLKHKPDPVSAKVLKERSCYFLEKCMKNVNHEVVKLLGFIASVKGLASIRDDIWEILKQNERMVDWGVVSEQVLGRSLSVWNEIMREMFLSRVKEILESHFESMLTSTKSQIAKVLTDFGNPDDKMLQYERDLSSYIWTESAQDIPTHRAWLKVNPKMLSEGGSLMMKAHSYSPKVQALCAVVDHNLSVLLEDCCHYTQNSRGEGGQVTAGSGDNGNFEPFNRLGDREAVQEFLQNACEDSINKLLGHLNQQLYACKQQLSNNKDQAGNDIIINRILLLGRFSGAICDLSPHLQASMSISLNEEQGNSSGGRTNKKSSTSLTSSKSPQNPRMAQMRSKLATFSTDAFSVWSESTVERLALSFANVLKDTSVRAILASCTHWDNIDIEEETEDGKKVKSTIRVPMQASWYVQTLLYNLCHDINKTGSHSIQYSVLSDLIQKLTDRILGSYESLLTSSSSDSGFVLAQNRSLQLWFDVKFLMNVLLKKDEAEVGKEFQKRYKKILERLESRIDPFDFDVFYPHLQSHLGRKMTRSNVLYGLLGHGDRGSGVAVTSASSSQQEQHNILPLSTSQNRFSLLPLSIHRNPQSVLNPIIQAPKLKSAQSMGTMATVPSAANQSPPPRVTSSSFLEQMSTMWFSNIKS